MGCGASKDSKPGPIDHKAQEEPTSTNGKTDRNAGSPSKGGGKGGRKMGNVFATPLEILGVREGYKIPVHLKSADETNFIKDVVIKNFIFEHLTKKEINRLVDAFEKTTFNKKGTNIIKQGDVGDYFYVIYSGSVEFEVNDKVVGTAKSGASFGELALMYTSPRAATVKTLSDEVIVYRVDQATFRYILQAQTKEAAGEKVELLKMVSFLKDLNTTQINKLAAVMTPKKFSKGDYLMRKGDAADFFYILGEGQVTAKNVGVGQAKFEDLKISKRGDYFGERALVTGEPRAADIVADTEVTAFAIDKSTFETVLGNFNHLILRAQDKRKLEGIKVIAGSKLGEPTLLSLVARLEDKKFVAGSKIYEHSVQTSSPALYLVRDGEVTIKNNGNQPPTIVGMGGYFGDDQLMADVTKKPSRSQSTKTFQTESSPSFVPTSTAIVTGDCTVAVLSLVSCRKIFDTRLMGTAEAGESVLKVDEEGCDTMLDTGVLLEDLKRHAILGQGTFGQVWLVSRKVKDSSGTTKETPNALKVQSKFELVRDGQAQAVAYEKQVMTELRHPFLLPLVNTYQDADFVYMLLGLVQGGELYSYVHRPNGSGMAESSGRFYAAGICEALGYMHRRGFVYRDLKPENVLIDAAGYPVVIDFGFAKKLTDKTYTLCGTPLYLPPEVILNRGHNWSCDHWSIGVMIYEMLFGDTPFYQEGMQQMDLFRTIVKGKYLVPETTSADEPASEHVVSIMRGLLTKDPAQRLGSLAGGEDDILEHSWFSNKLGKNAAIDFTELRRKTIKAPTIPNIRNPLDSSNFEDWSHLTDKTRTKFPKLTAEQDKVFAGF